MKMKFTSGVRTAIAFALRLFSGQIGGTPRVIVPEFTFFSDIHASDVDEVVTDNRMERTIEFFYNGVLVAIVWVVATREHTGPFWKVKQFRYKAQNGVFSDTIVMR